MSGFIHYISQKPVIPEVVVALREALERLDDGRYWLLCQPVSFADSDTVSKVEGWSKLTLRPSPQAIEEAKRRPTKEHDLRALVEILRHLSIQLEIDWELDVDGEPIGRIVDGICERRVQRSLDDLLELTHNVSSVLNPEACRRLDEYEELPQLRIYRGPDS